MAPTPPRSSYHSNPQATRVIGNGIAAACTALTPLLPFPFCLIPIGIGAFIAGAVNVARPGDTKGS